MTARPGLLLLLATGCAGAPPVPRAPPADLAPLPRSSIVAVLAHRSELDLTDDQVAALEQADAELQQRLVRLRAEGGLQAPSSGGPWRGSLHGGSPSEPGAAGGGQPVPGFGMNMGPGGFQVSPNMGGQGGTPPGAGDRGMGGGAPKGEPRAGPSRRDPARAQEALDASLDDADTAAFLKIEPVLAPAQRERAMEIANGYREQAFERRELLRGR